MKLKKSLEAPRAQKRFLFAPGFLFPSLLLGLSLAFAPAARAQNLVTLHSFSPLQSSSFGATNSDGVASTALIQDAAGNFYGAAQLGGAYGNGTIFRLSPGGLFTTLYSFSATNYDAALGVGTNADGANPGVGLVQAADSNLYGTAQYGGTNGNGTVFQITTNGVFTVLYTFSTNSTPGGSNLTNSDGAIPFAALVQGADGNLYGTAQSGGANGAGTFFQIVPPFQPGSLQFNPLYSFAENSDGSNPYPLGMVLGGDGNLYGVTAAGGPNDFGSVFEVTTNGAFTTLYSFSGAMGNASFDVLTNSDGINPQGVVFGLDGNLYGAAYAGGTNGFGTVFQLTTNGTSSVFQPIYEFGPNTAQTSPNPYLTNSDGGYPPAGLVLGSDGKLYGAASSFGPNGYGTLFQVTTAGVFQTLYSFSTEDGNGDNSDGANPSVGIIQGRDGNFYGATVNGGSNGVGTIFELISPTSPPVFTGQPSGQTNFAGGGVTLGPSVAGPGPFAYQWQLNLSNILGATNLVYTLPISGTGQSGDYRLIATNINGSVTSAVATVLVNPWSVSPLYSFSATNGPAGTNFDGASPFFGLIQGADGGLYGSANNGGTNGEGAVFRITTAGLLTPLYSFSATNSSGVNSDGAAPNALTQSGDSLYSTATYGGADGDGTVFALTTNGLLTTLHSFSPSAVNPADGTQTNQDGAKPDSGLVLAVDGTFYGTATVGGTNGHGTVFNITTSGVFNVLYTFTATNASGANFDGANPEMGVIQAADGALYGTTDIGGTNANGVVFKLATNGAFTPLYSLSPTNYDAVLGVWTNADGANPDAVLIQGLDGSLYGTARMGGTNGNGTVFQITTNGVFTVLYTFNPTNYDSALAVFTNLDGAHPNASLIQATDGNLYGATSDGGANGQGTLFEITTNGVLAMLYAFSSTNASGFNAEGSRPFANLLQASDGNFYGAALGGGTNGNGAVFGALNPFPALLVQPAAAETTLVGGAVTLSVTAGGEGPLTYQWEINGAALPGATNSTLALTNLEAYQSGGYTVLVSNTNASTLSSASALAVTPWTLVPIYSFSATNGGGDNSDGAYPVGGLVQGIDGGFYGTALDGGANGYGTVFAITNGSFNSGFTYSFSDGGDGGAPVGGLIQEGDGNLYGVSGSGGFGNGTIFQISTNGVLNPDFNYYWFSSLTHNTNADGAVPAEGLVADAFGNLYGTATAGGTSGNGAIFQITTNGVFTNLYSFTALHHGTNADGAQPVAGLVLANDGNLYGTAYSGGAKKSGTVFQVTTNGVFSTIYTFTAAPFDSAIGLSTNADGANPEGALVQGSDGNLYGTTFNGGANGNGTVFQIPLGLSGTLRTLYTFSAQSPNYSLGVYTNSDGAVPAFGLILGSDGNLYGTTAYDGAGGSGTLFRITTNGVLTTLYTFSALDGNFDNNEGANPFSSLIQGADGNFYGTAEYGGTNGVGAVFELINPYPTPVFTTQPVNESTYGGGSVIFSVSVSGAGPFTYQWESNGVAVVGATGPSLNLTNLTVGSSGSFSVAVANPNATVTSRSGSLTVRNWAFVPLYSFSALEPSTIDNFDGAYPQAALVQANDGNLYGSTIFGGTNGSGAVFRISPAGVFQPVYSFGLLNNNGMNIDGTSPDGALMQGLDGNLYGTTAAGGTNSFGTLFRLSTAGVFTPLYFFTNANDGGYPYGGPVQGADGSLFGTTYVGGTNVYSGAIFQLTPGGQFLPLYSLAGPDFDSSLGLNTNSDGSSPADGLVFGLDGNLYGTTQYGGTNGSGTVFQVTTGGQFTEIYTFSVPVGSGTNADGANPVAGITPGSDGRLYGVATNGGASGFGTVFGVTPGGVFTTLYSFSAPDANGFNADGAFPCGTLVQAKDGNLYGTTYIGGVNGNGTVFQITTNGVFTTIYSFSAFDPFSNTNSDGANPIAGLIQGTNGNLYGVAYNGGTNGVGSVFALINEIPPGPAVTVGAPTPTATTNGAGVSITFPVAYFETNFNYATLSAGSITVTGTGTAAGSVASVVGGAGSATGTNYTVTITNVTGVGALGISIASGTAVDLAGIPAPAASSSIPAKVMRVPFFSGDYIIANRSYYEQAGLVLLVRSNGVSATAQQILETELYDSYAVALATNGDVYAACYQTPTAFYSGNTALDGGVYKIDQYTSAITNVASTTNFVTAYGTNLVTPFGLAVEPGGNILVADLDAYTNLDVNLSDGTVMGGAIFRLNPKTGALTVLSTNGPATGSNFFFLGGIAVATNGGFETIYVTDDGDGVSPPKVLQIDPVTGVQTVLFSGSPLIAPVGLAVETTGSSVTNIVVADVEARAVIEVSTNSTSGAWIATAAPVTGGSFVFPTHVAIDPGTGDFLVTDGAPASEAQNSAGTLWRLYRSDWSMHNWNSGGFFEQPRGILIQP